MGDSHLKSKMTVGRLTSNLDKSNFDVVVICTLNNFFKAQFTTVTLVMFIFKLNKKTKLDLYKFEVKRLSYSLPEF